MALDATDTAGKLLPKYLCHKEVQALKIKRVDWRGGASAYVLIPEDDSFAPISVPKEYVDKHGPTAGGYYVVYQDGYASFSPARAFEEGYTVVVP